MTRATTVAPSGPEPRFEPHPTTSASGGLIADNTPLVTDPRLRLFVYLLLMSAMFMATLDNQIVSTALPTIVGNSANWSASAGSARPIC